jgi:hypothetical protein
MFASSSSLPSRAHFLPLLRKCEREKGSEMAKESLGKCKRVRECKGMRKRKREKKRK